jgi:hypothetical protein
LRTPRTVSKEITPSHDECSTLDSHDADFGFRMDSDVERDSMPNALTKTRGFKGSKKRNDDVTRSPTDGSASFINPVLEDDSTVSAMKQSCALGERKKHSLSLTAKSSYCNGSGRMQSAKTSNGLVVGKRTDVNDHDDIDDGKDTGDAARFGEGVTLYAKRRVKPNCKNTYDKCHFCKFCGRCIKSKIARHLLNVHIHEKDVREIRFLPKQCRQRRNLLQLLANEGDFKHNVAVLQLGRGKLVVGRRANGASSKPSEFLPCQYCHKFLKKINLWRHSETCPNRPQPCQMERPTQIVGSVTAEENRRPRTSSVRSAKAVLSAAVCLEEDADVLNLLDHMRDDEVKQVVMQDSLIRRYANLRLESFGRLSDQKIGDRYTISSGVRTLARLVLKVRSIKEIADLDSLLCPANFDLIIQATKSLSTDKEKPALNTGRAIGNLLNHAALIKSGMAIRENDERRKTDARNFLKLHKAEWTYRINSAATKRINNEKRLKALVIPLTEDLQNLRRFIMIKMKQYYRIVKDKKQPSDWVQLAKLTMSRLILFNKRRRAEVKDLKVREYLNRPKWHTEAAGEMAMALSATDRLLANRFSHKREVFV